MEDPAPRRVKEVKVSAGESAFLLDADRSALPGGAADAAWKPQAFRAG